MQDFLVSGAGVVASAWRQSAGDPRAGSMGRALLLWLALAVCATAQEPEPQPQPQPGADAEPEAEADVEPDTTVSVQVVEENWTIVLQPRCCSDCTFVSRGFKCKVKSCLSNCPWARSSATPSAVPLF